MIAVRWDVCRVCRKPIARLWPPRRSDGRTCAGHKPAGLLPDYAGKLRAKAGAA
jgi:hypothetical protein